MEALENFLRREAFPYRILSEALDPFIAHVRDLMGDGISDTLFDGAEFFEKAGNPAVFFIAAKFSLFEILTDEDDEAKVDRPRAQHTAEGRLQITDEAGPILVHAFTVDEEDLISCAVFLPVSDVGQHKAGDLLDVLHAEGSKDRRELDDEFRGLLLSLPHTGR